MYHKIVKNEGRKTVTVILSPVVIAFTDYLFEKFNGERYFASAVLKDAKLKEDIYPILKEIVDALNDVAKGSLPENDKFTGSDIFTAKEEEFRLFSRNIDKDGKWDGQFKVNLSSKSNDENKRFLFLDIKGEKPVKKEDGWKHFYAIEFEISVGYNEDELEKYIYTVFHRGISVGSRASDNFQKNDDAWSGFNFQEVVEETKQEEKTTDEKKSGDLPF